MTAVRQCQEKSSHVIFTVKFLFLMVVLPSRSSSLCADDPSVTASPLVLSHYYSKLLSPFFEELMPVNQLNPNQLLKEKYLVLCSFEIPFHIALLGKRW